jgi:hypothetical protein
MITDSFTSESSIVVVIFSGRITINDILEWSYTLSPARFPVNDLKILLNASTADYDFLASEFQEMDQGIMDLCNRFSTVRIARLHSKTKEISLSVIAHDRKLPSNYSTRIFINYNNALEWLMEL